MIGHHQEFFFLKEKLYPCFCRLTICYIILLFVGIRVHTFYLCRMCMCVCVCMCVHILYILFPAQIQVSTSKKNVTSSSYFFRTFPLPMFLVAPVFSHLQKDICPYLFLLCFMLVRLSCMLTFVFRSR